MYISINVDSPPLSSSLRWLPTTGRRRRKHQLHQLERGGFGGDADAPAAQEEAAEKPHVFYARADRGAGERCENKSVILSDRIKQ